MNIPIICIIILAHLTNDILSLTNNATSAIIRKKTPALLVKKHLKRLKKQEGAIKLVGGRAEFEGKVIRSKPNSFFLTSVII